MRAELFVIDPSDVEPESPDPMSKAILWATSNMFSKRKKILLVRSFELMPAKYAKELEELQKNPTRVASVVVHQDIDARRCVFNNEYRLYAPRFTPTIKNGDCFDDIFARTQKIFLKNTSENYSVEHLDMAIYNERLRHPIEFAESLSDISTNQHLLTSACLPLAVRKSTEKLSMHFQTNIKRARMRAEVDQCIASARSANTAVQRDDLFFLSKIAATNPSVRSSSTLPEGYTFVSYQKQIRRLILPAGTTKQTATVQKKKQWLSRVKEKDPDAIQAKSSFKVDVGEYGIDPGDLYPIISFDAKPVRLVTASKNKKTNN